MAEREWVLKIVGDVTSAQKSLGNLESDVGGVKKTISNTGKAIAGAFAVGAVIEFGKSLVNAASDQQQAVGAANSVFKEYGNQIQDFGKTTAQSMGLSRAEFSQLAAVSGALLKGVGVPLDQAAKSTTELTQRAADMAAMFGGPTSDAMEAINSALKGERDPIEKYGVSLKQSAVDAKAAAMGYTDAQGKVTDVGRTMATMQLIMEKTADSAGTFAKESDTVAGSSQIMKARFTDLQASLGTKLLPVIVAVSGVLVDLVTFMSNNQGWLAPLAAGILAIVAAVKVWTIVQAILNSTLLANPVFLIIAAIVALIAIVVVLYTKVDWFRNAVDAAIGFIVDAWNWLKDNIDNIGHAIMIAIEIYFAPFFLTYKAIKATWEHLPEVFSAVVSGLATALSTVWNVIKWPFEQGFTLVKAVIDKVAGWISGMVSGVEAAISNVWNVIKWPFEQGAQLAKAALDSITNLASGIGNKISGFMSGVANLIKAPFQTAFNAIKSLWNNTVGGFGFSVPSWVPGIGGKGFKIPSMATGGIIRVPTIALLGEAGPEAVVPLDKAGGFGGVTINVYALTASAEVGRQVYNALREYERTTGK